jgi:GT2 family glycosyltransferase
MSRVDIVIVNFNTREHLRSCLDSIDRDEANSVMVVDSSSTDGSVDMLRTDYPWVKLISQPNRGFGAAANRGLKESHSDYLLLLNSDTVLEADTASALAAHLDEHPTAAVVGPRLLNTDGTLQPSCYPFLTPLNVLLVMTLLSRVIGFFPVFRERHLPTSAHASVRIVPWVKGAALALRRAPILRLGGFDESYFMYSEELDLCYRLRATGWEVHYTPAAIVRHVGGASTVNARAAMSAQVFTSLIRFYEKHYSPLRMIGLRFVLAIVMTARIARDTIRLRRTHDAETRAAVRENIDVWRKTLLGS